MKDDVVFEYCWPNTVEIATNKPEVRVPTDHLNALILKSYLEERPELARRAGNA
jgi:hypothetical protein